MGALFGDNRCARDSRASQGVLTMPAHIWITTYDTLRQDIDQLVEGGNHVFDLAILDEAQRIKNAPRASHRQSDDYRIGTGGHSPHAYREPDFELASIFAFLKPGLFPNHDVLPDYARSLIARTFSGDVKRMFQGSPDEGGVSDLATPWR